MMTSSEKIAAVALVAIQRHAPFFDDPKVAVRSVNIRVMITASGDPRAVIVNFESEQNYNPLDTRGMPGGAPALPRDSDGEARETRPPTMGKK